MEQASSTSMFMLESGADCYSIHLNLDSEEDASQLFIVKVRRSGVFAWDSAQTE
jgi:hypothetical protein